MFGSRTLSPERYTAARASLDLPGLRTSHYNPIACPMQNLPLFHFQGPTRTSTSKDPYHLSTILIVQAFSGLEKVRTDLFP